MNSARERRPAVGAKWTLGVVRAAAIVWLALDALLARAALAQGAGAATDKKADKPAAATVALVIDCDSGCDLPLEEGQGRRPVRLLVTRASRPDTLRAVKVSLAADTGTVFPSVVYSDEHGHVRATWSGRVGYGGAVYLSATGELGDSARGSALLRLPSAETPADRAFGLAVRPELRELRWYAGGVVPERIEFRVTRPQDMSETTFASRCEAIRVALRASFKKATEDSAADTVTARYRRDEDQSSGECVAGTRWRLADVPGVQTLDATLVGERPRVRDGREMVTTRAQARAVAHSYGHFIVGLGWPSGGRSRSPSDTSERTVVPIVGADFSLVSGARHLRPLVPLLDRARVIAATRINKIGSESFIGLQLPQIFEGAAAEKTPLLLSAGWWFGPKGTKARPFLGLSYDATPLVSNALTALGIIGAGK